MGSYATTGERAARPDWPCNTDVQEIVQKSSGQFIYSSVVINFVPSPRHHPARQLEIIRGLRPAGKLTPFAQLDVLYRHILSQIQDIDRTFLVLAWAIFGADSSISNGFTSYQFSAIARRMGFVSSMHHSRIFFLIKHVHRNTISIRKSGVLVSLFTAFVLRLWRCSVVCVPFQQC